MWDVRIRLGSVDLPVALVLDLGKEGTMPTFRRFRRRLAAVLLVVYVAACHHYVPLQEMTPEAYVASKHPKQVRLTLNDITHGLHRLELLTPSVTVALSTIERVAVREYDSSGTTGAVLGGMAVAGVVALVAVLLVARGAACAHSGGC
ncbi:MAG: hypothetical protein OEY20_13390 [Gemmatimonadota bacterium]|nr:hypothetical protein [Gemmatimonadota bacterium]MDH5198231.1 hypothetical protein [Gemmatimonadota bacterium]